MVTSQDLLDAAATVRADRDALGEPLTRRTPDGAGGYTESSIRGQIAPVPYALVSMGLYLLSDVSLETSSAVLKEDEIARFGVTYFVLDDPFVQHLVDQVTGYRTILRQGSRPSPW